MDIYLPIAEMPVSVLLILGMGAAVGFISGLFGIGGGFLMTPLLIFLGIPPAIAVGSQTAQIVASSTTSALGALKRGALDLKLGLILVAAGAVGTVLGVAFFAAMRRIGQLEFVIVISYVTLFTIVGGLMIRESIKDFWPSERKTVRTRRRGGEHAPYLFWPLKVRFYRSRLYISIIPVVGLAVFVGFAGALLGIGGGFIMVPALAYVFRVPIGIVVGTSQFQILCTTVVALILHAVANEAVDGVLALLLIIGGVFGAQFGARAGRNLRSDVFRLLLAVLILAVGLRFAVELVLTPREPFSIAIEGAPA